MSYQDMKEKIGVAAVQATKAVLCSAVLAFSAAVQAAEWIWIPREGENVYAEFRTDFDAADTNVLLRVSVAGEFAAKVNGKLVSFGQYRDYPEDKTYTEASVGRWVRVGANELVIQAFYSGNRFSSHVDGRSGLWAEVVSGNKTLASSSTNWLARPTVQYGMGERSVCFGSFDWTFGYDATVPSAPFAPAVTASPRQRPRERPVQAGRIGQEVKGRLVSEGADYALFDLGRIACGFLRFSLTAPSGTRILVKNREYLRNGRVPNGGPQPGDEFVAAGGCSDFTHLLRRVGARYLEFRFPAGSTKVEAVSLEEIEHDGFGTPELAVGDPFWQKLYEMSARTLRNCWQERLVSNVWREQAAYPYDSRFALLWMYSIWPEKAAVAAAQLDIFGADVKSNGYVKAVGPTAKEIWIPIYTFAWMSAVAEQVEYSGSRALFDKYALLIADMTEKILSHTKEGLFLPPDGAQRWDYLEPDEEPAIGKDISPPNAFYNLYLREALLKLAPLYRLRGEAARADRFDRLAADIGERCVARFWDASRGLFCDRIDANGVKLKHLLHVNALFLAQGLVPPEHQSALIDRLVSDELPVRSFSVLKFLVEGVAKYGSSAQDKTLDARLRRIYAPQAERGDTCWESPLGRDYAGGTGSLCQSWGAFPAWYAKCLSCSLKKKQRR